MKILILISLLSVSLFAQTKADLNKMLGQLKAQGVFTEEQIEAAKIQLQSMDQKDMDKLIQAGKAQMNNPEIQKKLKELKN
jgi:hypothetical protein